MTRTYLKHIGIGVFRVLHDDSLAAAECVRDGVLAGVQYRLAAVGRLDHVVLRAPDAVGGRSSVQHELASAATPLARGQVAVVSVNISHNIIHMSKYKALFLKKTFVYSTLYPSRQHPK